MCQCDSEDLDDKFSTSMVWNNAIQTPSLMHIMDACVIATAMGSHDLFMTYFKCNRFS